MHHPSFPPGRWRARWIWAGASTAGDAPPQGRHVIGVRRQFCLPSVPPSAPARICAVSRYVLLVNGTEAARGPLRSNPRRQPYDVVDLAPILVAGENVVAALVCFYKDATPWWLPLPYANDVGAGGFVFEARLGEGDGEDDWLVSDASWQASVLTGWGAAASAGLISGRGRELIDARAFPAGWLERGDDTAGWPAAIVRRAHTTGEAGRPEPPTYPIGPLHARATSWPVPKPVDLRRAGGAASDFTMERIVVGTVVLDAEIPAGAQVSLQPSEFLDASGAPSPSEHDTGLVFTGDGTRRTLESFDLYGLRGIRVEAPAGATIHGLTVRERSYPVAGSASFACSDPDLDRIWQVGRRTVSLCSLDSYVDCPTREQRAWTGDSVVHQMVDLATNADWGLARWHAKLTASPRPDGMLPMAVAGDIEQADFTIIPDWALHWVHSVWNLYRWVGDRDEIAELLPVVEGVVRWFVPFCGDDGLPRDVFGWVIIDWASVYTEGACAPLCGLWGRALLELAEMAQWLGDANRAAWARATHARLAAAFEKLWDPARRRYADSLVGETLRPMASQHGQAAAIVGRLAPQARWPRLLEVMLDETNLVHASFSITDGPTEPNTNVMVGGDYLGRGHPEPWWDVERQIVRAQPFFRYVVHDAVVAAGRADRIASLCRDWKIALERCPTSWTETWYGGTVSHGWSSTPTRDLTTRVLGIEPEEPGFAVARIDPALGDLAWARGSAPCPAGSIEVDANAETKTLVVTSPVPFLHGGKRFGAGKHTIPL
jgi:hypothetical protein